MVITCISCASCCIIKPTRCATSPETPVSISSKMMVGKAVFFAINDLMVNINLDNSPPDATLFSSFN